MTDNDYELAYTMGMRGLTLGKADAGDRALFDSQSSAVAIPTSDTG